MPTEKSEAILRIVKRSAAVLRDADIEFALGGRRAARAAGATTEHDVDFVARIAHKVTVLHEGSVLAEGSMEQIQKNQQVIEVFLGR